jgi:hypothetical protein
MLSAELFGLEMIVDEVDGRESFFVRKPIGK